MLPGARAAHERRQVEKDKPAAEPRDDQPIPYEEFRSSWDFASVRELLQHEQDTAREKGQYMFVSRGTVLGRWHELKQQEYARYLAHFDRRQEAPGRPWTWGGEADPYHMTKAEAAAEGLPF